MSDSPAWCGPRDPIGHQLRWGLNIPGNLNPWITIVGVVADVKESSLGTAAIGQIYVPIAQDDTGSIRAVNLIVRSPQDPASLVADVRGALQRVDSSLPAVVEPLEGLIDDAARPQRFSVTVMAAFAGLALLLAALGVYGVLANAVAQQTPEIGVRIAMGATTFDVLWMVLRRALTLMGLGLGIGLAGALVITQTMAGLLFEVKPTDVTSFAGAMASLAIVALVSSLFPAWRATHVDSKRQRCFVMTSPVSGLTASITVPAASRLNSRLKRRTENTVVESGTIRRFPRPSTSRSRSPPTCRICMLLNGALAEGGTT